MDVFVTVGPGQYHRNAGLLLDAGLYIKRYGTTAVLVGGNTSRQVIDGPLRQGLSECGVNLKHSLWFGGESSQTNIDRLVEQLNDVTFDVIIAAGGGKSLDTAKAAAFQLNKPLVAIPTIAATCAAATPICILYSDDGEFLEISRNSKVPE